ncbi:MAG: tryptophan-rich sensory protein [Saprospiraceae bacterium]|nr:tryptophan-rich sensory protein [Saprospiraceae bacterium]
MIKLNIWAKVMIGISVCLMVGFISGLSTQESLQSWYANLEKPSFNPPNWIFAPVWTVLYALMGISAGLIWDAGWKNKPVQNAIMLFLAQLILNATWSVVFFGTQSPIAALVIILALLILIWLCMRRLRPINRWATVLLLPYFLWVSFATILNASIVYLN